MVTGAYQQNVNRRFTEKPWVMQLRYRLAASFNASKAEPINSHQQNVNRRYIGKRFGAIESRREV